MLKSLEGQYRAGMRGRNWLKLKREYRNELGDSLDLVVIGAFFGKGRRTGRYGTLLVATYNDENDTNEEIPGNVNNDEVNNIEVNSDDDEVVIEDIMDNENNAEVTDDDATVRPFLISRRLLPSPDILFNNMLNPNIINNQLPNLIGRELLNNLETKKKSEIS